MLSPLAVPSKSAWETSRAPQFMSCRELSPIIRVLSVESHPVFREGLKSMIEAHRGMQLTAEVSDAREALESFRRHRPDITLMELHLAGGDSLSLLKSIREEAPKARILILTSSDQPMNILRAMRAGASGYLLKFTAKSELLRAIETVHRGGRHMAPEIAIKLADCIGDSDLTTRECEVLKCVSEGYSSKQIVDKLYMAEPTVNFHIKNVVSKLGAKNRSHAITIAFRRGLI